MDFEGKVLTVLPVVKGTNARGEWVKQEVIFEQPGEFNRKICVGFWGDKAAEAGTLQPGEMVNISAGYLYAGRVGRLERGGRSALLTEHDQLGPHHIPHSIFAHAEQ